MHENTHSPESGGRGPRPRRSAFVLEKSSINFAIEAPTVFWEMARNGHLGKYACLRSRSPIGDDGVVLEVNGAEFLVSLKLNSKVRDAFQDVQFGTKAFTNQLSKSLGAEVAVDPINRSIKVTNSSASATWPPPGGMAYDRLFEYKVPFNTIKSAKEFSSHLESAMKILRAYLAYGYHGSHSTAPSVNLVIEPPKDMRDQFEGKTTDASESTSEDDEEYICRDSVAVEKPKTTYSDLTTIAEAVSLLQRETRSLKNPNEKSPEAKLGLVRRHIFIIEGNDYANREKLVDALANDLGALVCHVQPGLHVNGGKLFLSNLWREVQPYLEDVLSKRIVIHLLDYDNSDYEESNVAMFPVHLIPASDLISVFDEKNAWNNVVIVYDTTSRSSLDPSIQSVACAVVDADLSERGTVKLIKDTIGAIGERSSEVRFRFHPVSAAEMFHRIGCRNQGDIVLAIEQAVRNKNDSGKLADGIGENDLDVAWDTIKHRRAQFE